jgi:hypothetical protein
MLHQGCFCARQCQSLTRAARTHAAVQGGACNPTCWRQRLAVPFLRARGLTFFDPQVDSWSPELVATENEAKARARVLLFVLARETRGVASMVEAAELIARGRRILLVIEPWGETPPVAGDELKDLDRGRAYLADMAARYGVAVLDSVESALEALPPAVSAALGAADHDGGAAEAARDSGTKAARRAARGRDSRATR